jgi:hypothetical protein
MFGLMVLIAILFYLALCVGAVYLTYRLTKNFSWPITWILMIIVFIGYNTPVASIVIPPIMAMDENCQYAGLWVYKTPDKWVRENPGVAETLIRESEQIDHQLNETTSQRIYHLNQRFDWVIEVSTTVTKDVHREIQTIVDRKTNDIMAKHIDYRAVAYPLYTRRTCYNNQDRDRWRHENMVMHQYVGKFRGLGKEQ